jgi:hypothetical protein
MRLDEMLARRLTAEVEAELDSLMRLGQELNAAPAGSDTFSLRARASILHDFYTIGERIFVRIAEELNGGVPRSDHWHRQILQDMALDLQNVRPAVIPVSLAQELGEFLRFRHVFRNAYGFVLEADRMGPLEDALHGVLDRFVTQIRTFNAWMLGEESS